MSRSAVLMSRYTGRHVAGFSSTPTCHVSNYRRSATSTWQRCVRPTTFSLYTTPRPLINVHTLPNLDAVPPPTALWEPSGALGPGKTVTLNRMTSDGVETARPPYSTSDTGALLMTEWCPFCYCSPAALSRRYTAAHPSLSFIARTTAVNAEPDGT